MQSSISPHPVLDAQVTSGLNDVTLLQEQRIRNWQVTTWWVTALATVLVVANCYQYATRKESYALVQLDGIGVSRYVSELSAASAQTMPIKMLLVTQFIRGIRTVSIDQKFQEQSMNASYFMAREKAQSYLRDYFSRSENDPKTWQKKGISKVPVNIEVAPQTENTFTVAWVEEEQEITETKRTRWQGTVTLEMKDPSTLSATERGQSPLGIWVSYVAFSNMGKI